MQAAEPEAAAAPGYGIWHACLDAVAIVLFAVGAFTLLATTALGKLSLLLQVASLLLALLAADFISGVVHFLADNFGSPETPIVGRLFIFPFREHHADPLAITRHSFLETNGASCLVSLPALGVTLWATDAERDALLRFWLFCFFVAILATNQVHKWAHMANPPRTVRLLQSSRLILSPRSHAIHHTAPHDRYYCITTGWLNYPLSWARFFPWLTQLLR